MGGTPRISRGTPSTRSIAQAMATKRDAWTAASLTRFEAAILQDFVRSGGRRLEQFVRVVDAVVNRNLQNRIILFDDQSGCLSGFEGGVGALRLPVYLEQKSATFRPLALRQHFLDFLLRTILYGHFDLARRHSLLLFGDVSGCPEKTH